MDTGRSSLVVHNFVPATAGNRKSASLSKDELLSKGRDLVAAVESCDGWRTVSSPSDLSAHIGRTLVLKKTPPTPSSFRRDLGRKRSVKPTKELGDISDRRDMLDIMRLKDFEGTDFSYLLDRKKPVKDLPPRIVQVKKERGRGRGKRTSEVMREEQGDDSEQRQKKRPRVGDVTTALHDLIPQPHHHSYLPVAVNQRSSLDITKRFPPYSKAPFLSIASFSPREAETYFKDPYARNAWVIPVKGKLPWKEATPARLSDNSPVSAPQPSYASPSITWTPFVINKFWSDLLEIRKQQILGAISLSFHVAPTEKPQEKITKATYLERTLMKEALPESLDQCSYVKVYHDVRYAMYVRSVLDAWRTEVEVPGTKVASRSAAAPGRTRSGSVSVPVSKKIKMRPLQGAKLVLLDEVGQAVGVC